MIFFSRKKSVFCFLMKKCGTGDEIIQQMYLTGSIMAVTISKGFFQKYVTGGVMGNSVLSFESVREIINLALREDIGSGDITSNAIFSGSEISDAVIIAKQEGILCGGDMTGFVFQAVDPAVTVQCNVKEGERVVPGDTVLSISGPTGSILTGERTALNFLQRMSGIATKTAKIATMLKGTGIQVLDTRKTVPGHRVTDKYAVHTGGGTNHRIGLFDMVMIKDNHIKAAGGITRAVEMVKSAYGEKYRVEVETTCIGEVKEAVACGADVIMLDNMKREQVIEAVEAIGGKAKIEVSGNIDEYKIHDLLDIKTGYIDYISMGSLTHSVEAFDFSMKFLK